MLLICHSIFAGAWDLKSLPLLTTALDMWLFGRLAPDHGRRADGEQITRASVAAPYLSLVLELDLAIIADLAVEMGTERVADSRAGTGRSDRCRGGGRSLAADAAPRPAGGCPGIANAARPRDALLAPRRPSWHGHPASRMAERSCEGQVARAVAVLRTEFAKTLPGGRLAAVSRMSPCCACLSCRDLEQLSPLQFQKHLRLIEARRLMMSDGASASSAAFAVGYESVSQFTREYGRMFGLPPVKDMKSVRSRAAGWPERRGIIRTVRRCGRSAPVRRRRQSRHGVRPSRLALAS